VAPILSPIPEPPLGQPGWNLENSQMLARVNTIPEIALDALAQKLLAGPGVSLSYNSSTRVLSLSMVGSGGLSEDDMMTFLASHILPGENISIVNNAEDRTLTIRYSGVQVIEQVVDLRAELDELRDRVVALEGGTTAGAAYPASYLSTY
jgi:hypothetical protein